MRSRAFATRVVEDHTMANEHINEQQSTTGTGNEGGGAATVERPEGTRPRSRQLPPWKVLLHNDDVNDMLYVVDTIIELTTLKRQEAVLRMLEAHKRGLALLISTHREHAELLEEQFTSKKLTVTIEPGE
jgi:ATP-dependent Clp protease adapter protein ClpS